MQDRLNLHEVLELAHELWSDLAWMLDISLPPEGIPKSLIRTRERGRGVQEVELWAPWAPLEPVPAIRIEGTPEGRISILHLPLGRQKIGMEEQDALPYWEASLDSFHVGSWHRKGGSLEVRWDTSVQIFGSADAKVYTLPSPPLSVLKRFLLAYLLTLNVCIGGRTSNPFAFLLLKDKGSDDLLSKLLRLGEKDARVTGPLTVKLKPSLLEPKYWETTLVVELKVRLPDRKSTSTWPFTLRRWFSPSFLKGLIPKT